MTSPTLLPRAWRYDDGELRKRFSPSVVEKFLSNIIPEPMSGCMLWNGSDNGHGYGYFWFNGKGMVAHRFSMILSGFDPGDKFVCHKCDTPSCVNPLHLFIGTAKDNAYDAEKKGRRLFGRMELRPKSCKNGHPFNEENTYTHVGKDGVHRKCRICNKLNHRAYYYQ